MVKVSDVKNRLTSVMGRSNFEVDNAVLQEKDNFCQHLLKNKLEVEEVLLNRGDGLLDAGALKKCQNATCFLYCNTQDTVKNATGFFAAIKIKNEEHHVIVTNHHVFRNKEEAQNGVARFYYEGNLQGADARLRPDILFYTDQELDYTIMGCDHDQIENNFCINPIIFECEQDIKVGDDVFIFQHPRGETKKLSYEAISRIEHPFVYYNADTDVGSSGSCVLRNLKLIALHSKGSDVLQFNKGVLCSAILKHLNDEKRGNMVTPSLELNVSQPKRKFGNNTGIEMSSPKKLRLDIVETNDAARDVELTEELLNELAKDIVGYWKPLGRKLGLSNSMIISIQKDHINYDDVNEKAYAMLSEWKEGSGPTAQQLKNKLIEYGKVRVAKKYFPD